MKHKNRIGKYELGRTVGEGNFAKVKCAINVETGQSYAVKILDKEKVFRYNLVDRIKREICTLKLIRHPHIVRLYEVLANKKKIFIILEFVTGGELFNKISCNGELEESEARKYFQQLIDAVGYCHSRGVYHRDLKLENVLLDAKGNVKISDFGLSAMPQQLRADGLLHTTCGSPNYVAPEVIADRGYHGATADVWSCGVILFVILTGWLPFEDRNVVVLYHKIFKSEFNCPNWLSAGAGNLVKRILDPNPKTRITIPEIVEDEWFKEGYSPAKFVEEDDTCLDNADVTNREVVFWKWIMPKMLGLITQTSVYHYSLEGDAEPARMFDRTANLSGNQIINYRCDPSEKWLVLIGIFLGEPERPQLVKGNMLLFSVDQ